MLTKGAILKHYKRLDIQEALLEHAKDKEIGMQFGTGFGKRPDVLVYPRDVIELALKGVTSFHSSEERWQDPLQLHSNILPAEMLELRNGWDLMLDIDCKIFEYSRICAYLVIEFLKYCGVKTISCKFSGNKGFHIGVPFEAFPTNIGEKLTKDLFPEAPRKIAGYVTANIEDELAKQIMQFENNNLSTIKDKVEMEFSELVTKEEKAGQIINKLNVASFLEIDTILIASRHLYRMPYSLHEKSGLCSLPIDPDKVLQFEKSMGNPDKILMTMFKFLPRDVEVSGSRLLLQAMDFKPKNEEKEEKKYDEIIIESAITEELFPDCIKKILEGMQDGKKRAVFILMNFLGKIGWNKLEIEKFLYDWNKKNSPPLRQAYINGQLNHFKPGDKLPPNCETDGYYVALGLGCDKDHCKTLKNPVNYTISRYRRRQFEEKMQSGNKKKSSKKEDVSKENNKNKEKGEPPPKN